MTLSTNDESWRSDKTARWKRFVPVVLAVCAGIGLSLAALAVLCGQQTREIQADFRRAAEDRSAIVRRAIQTNLHALESIRSLFFVSDRVDRDEFREFVKPLFSQMRAIHTVQWVPRVPNARRPDYFPVDFIKPYRGNEAAVGFDLGSNPTLLEAINLSRDTGETVATARIVLARETVNKYGFRVLLPVYKKGMPADTVDNRRKYLRGFVVAVLQIADVVESGITRLHQQGIDTYLCDESAPPGKRLLFFHSARTRKRPYKFGEGFVPDRPNGMRYITALEVDGRQWSVLCVPVPGWVAARRTWCPWGVFMGGLILTGLPAAYFLVSICRITRMERLLVERTTENVVLGAINRAFKETLACETEEDIARLCLSIAQELTGSKFGFIGEVNEAGRLDTVVVSNSGWGACRIPKSDAAAMLRDMEIRGIWGGVIKRETPMLTNDPASSPDRSGTPEGHPPITSFLGVPLKQGGKTIGLVGLANKEPGYELADQQSIEALSVAYTEALNRKRAERQIKAAREKEVLLREIHHRVKNNLQIICSLLNLQSEHVEDAVTRSMFQNTRNRVLSMAMVHEQLYQTTNLSGVDFGRYIRRLATELFCSYSTNPALVALKINADDVTFDIDTAIPCSLILTELLSNSLKHAFPEDREGEIRIDLRSDNEGEVTLRVADNGIGLPEGLDIQNAQSLGLRLVHGLIGQLEGAIQVDGGEGAKFTITFPK